MLIFSLIFSPVFSLNFSPFFRRTLLAFSLSLLGFAQIVSAQISLADSSLQWYLQGKNWLQLQTFQTKPKTDYQPNLHYKNSHPQYNYYFAALTIDKLAFRGHYFEILPNNGLKITNLRSDATFTVDNPDAQTARYGQHFLFEANDGVVYVKHLSGDAGYKIYKYNVLGELLFSQQIQHTDKVSTEKLEYFRPYLQYLSHTPNELLFASYEPQKKETTVVNLSDGSLKKYDFSAQGGIRRAADIGQNRIFRGFIYSPANSQNLEIQLLNKAEKAFSLSAVLIAPCSSFEGIVKDNILTVVAYDRSRSGAQLLGIDIEAGNVIWTKQIAAQSQPPTPFYNKMWLSHIENKIILEGTEAGRKYLQIYDFDSGKLLYSNL
jgi:hypothetical protein